MHSDLDNLKNSWKAFKEISQNNESHTKSQLQEILKKDSKQIGYRFRRLLWIETIVSIIFTVVFVVLILESPTSFQLFWTIMVLIYLAASGWLAYQLYKFPTQTHIESSLHNSLEEQIDIANKFIPIYTKANIILAVPSTLIGFLVGIQLGRGEKISVYFQEMIQNENYIKLFALSALALILSLLVTYSIKKYVRWYIKKTYGKYLEELNTLRIQLTE